MQLCPGDGDLTERSREPPRRRPEERPGESQPLFPELVGAAPESPAGPVDAEPAAALAVPPSIELPKVAQTLRFSMRQIEFVFKARRELGEVFRMRGVIPGGPVITSHPDHVKSLFTAKPELAPTISMKSGEILAASEPLKMPPTYTNTTRRDPTSDSSGSAITSCRIMLMTRCAVPA